jgi:hypothetical protein
MLTCTYDTNLMSLFSMYSWMHQWCTPQMFIHLLLHLHWIPSHAHLYFFGNMDILELINMILWLKSLFQDLPLIWFFIFHMLLKSVVAIPCRYVYLHCHNWCCVNCLRSWNRHCYLAWNFMNLVNTSSKFSIHW